MPGEGRQLSHATSSAKGAERLEVRNREGESICGRGGFAELYGTGRRGVQHESQYPVLSSHSVKSHHQEFQGDGEGRILSAGARLPECAADVVLMGEGIEDELGGWRFESILAHSLDHRVDRLAPEIEQLIDSLTCQAINLRAGPRLGTYTFQIERHDVLRESSEVTERLAHGPGRACGHRQFGDLGALSKKGVNTLVDKAVRGDRLATWP